MGTALENLSGYTSIQEYYDIDGGKEELIDRLKRNNSKIPDQDMISRAAQERVIEEYEQRMETLRPPNPLTGAWGDAVSPRKPIQRAPDAPAASIKNVRVPRGSPWDRPWSLGYLYGPAVPGRCECHSHPPGDG